METLDFYFYFNIQFGLLYVLGRGFGWIAAKLKEVEGN